MVGQMTIYDFLQPETCQIKKSRFSDWMTVSLDDALLFAHKKWSELKGVRENIRAQYINEMMISGHEFSEEEIIEGVLK